MNSRRQDYLSIACRNLCFAFFAPLGSIIFQWLVFKKDVSTGHLGFSILVLLIGSMFLALGYIMLREK